MIGQIKEKVRKISKRSGLILAAALALAAASIGEAYAGQTAGQDLVPRPINRVTQPSQSSSTAPQGSTSTSAQSPSSGQKKSTASGSTRRSAPKNPLTSKAKVGRTYTFGTYEQDGNISNGKEPIKWIVLAKSGKKLLVISKYALDFQPYHKKGTATTWAGCSLRKWLNNTFYKKAFNSQERRKILKRTVKGAPDIYSNMPAGKSTKDRIFLLSLEEINRYLPTKSLKRCKPTRYVAGQPFAYWYGETYWWARTSADYWGTTISSYGDGIDDCAVSVANGVRPVMWVKP